MADGRAVGRLLLAVALGAVLAALGAVLGVVESFFHVAKLAGVPVGAVAAAVVNLAVTHLVGRGTRSRLYAIVPGATWFLAVVVLALGRPEGDVVVASNALGYGYLLAGAVGAVAGVMLLPWYSLPAQPREPRQRPPG